jgi:hypothetical protein
MRLRNRVLQINEITCKLVSDFIYLPEDTYYITPLYCKRKSIKEIRKSTFQHNEIFENSTIDEPIFYDQICLFCLKEANDCCEGCSFQLGFMVFVCEDCVIMHHIQFYIYKSRYLVYYCCTICLKLYLFSAKKKANNIQFFAKIQITNFWLDYESIVLKSLGRSYREEKDGNEENEVGIFFV